MDVDRPEVVAEIAAEFAGYEAALVAGDVDAVVGYFWASARTVRFGVADHQIGIEEQRRWRSAQPPLPPGRRLHGTLISTFGTDTAVVNTFFDYPGGAATGRQTQTWVRLPVGWRIVSAHVSEYAAVPARP
ncbi:AtzH-like domain-containing protein [Plantactinospora sp. WMMB782]|uniref:AtzH-like domain-containing protein n=1 Tax=Plantactinospora sp. WMMB782 TaxID=3404121 RepID=UPI003B95C079